MLPVVPFVTNASEPEGFITINCGFPLTGVFAFTTVLVETLIILIVPESESVTYAVVPEGENTIPVGLEPTVIFFITVFVAVLITLTPSEPESATYTSVPAGLIAIPLVAEPPVTLILSTVFVVKLTTSTVPSRSVTYIVVPDGEIARSVGYTLVRFISFTTVLDETFITATSGNGGINPCENVTYANAPEGENAMSSGDISHCIHPEFPRDIVPAEVFAFTFITLTVLEFEYITYASVPVGLNATPIGAWPTFIVLTTGEAWAKLVKISIPKLNNNI